MVINTKPTVNYIVGSKEQIENAIISIDKQCGYPEENGTLTYGKAVKHPKKDEYMLPVISFYIKYFDEKVLETLGVEEIDSTWIEAPEIKFSN